MRRVFSYDNNGVREDVLLSISSLEPDGDDHVCVVEIKGGPFDFSHRSYGVDGIQAVILALRIAGTQIYTSPASAANRLAWLEGEEGYGLPLPASIKDMYRGSDTLLG